MVKYTHLIERCSSFLRTGIAWRLKPHGYTFTGAYWRLREGKGLISAYDQESLKQWSNLITAVRRGTAAAAKLKAEEKASLTAKRNDLLACMEAYRDRLEHGSPPQYLYDNSFPCVVEHLLATMVGDIHRAAPEQQLSLWLQLDTSKLKAEAETCMNEIENYRKQSKERKDLPSLEEWMTIRFDQRIVKDKVWQIRTGHDERSSVGAGINERLVFLWDIPSMTDKEHRSIYKRNKKLLETYKSWKEDEGVTATPEKALAKIYKLLGSIKIPDLK